jgi:hypothetical protein
LLLRIKSAFNVFAICYRCARCIGAQKLGDRAAIALSLSSKLVQCLFISAEQQALQLRLLWLTG